MAPRRQNMIRNTRMDAALDAMNQFGFNRKLVRETVDELLNVYEGNQGWPFIEEAYYKLLIETILSKQQDFVEKKDNTRMSGISESASAATARTGITEVVGCSSLVALDSASQTTYHDNSPSLDILRTDVKNATLPTERGTNGRGIRVESKNKQKTMDNVQGSNHKSSMRSVENTTLRSSMMEFANKHDKLMDSDKRSSHKTSVNNTENTIAENSIIESSKTSDELPHKRRRPCFGWNGSDDNLDLLYFPVPEHFKKLIVQGDGSRIPMRKNRMRKNRWGEKPDM